MSRVREGSQAHRVLRPGATQPGTRNPELVPSLERSLLKAKECPQCQGCPLARLFPERNLVLPAMGPGKRLIVGEAAGADEELEGKPFVGSSGRMLDSFLRKAGVNREQLTVANTLSCRPPENVYPTDDAARAYCTKEEGERIVKHCIKNHLLPVLESRPWDRIDLIGGKALQWLANKTGVLKWRGFVVEVDTEEIRRRVS